MSQNRSPWHDTDPVGLPTSGGEDSVHPVAVDVEVAEHERAVIHDHGVDLDELVLVLL